MGGKQSTEAAPSQNAANTSNVAASSRPNIVSSPRQRHTVTLSSLRGTNRSPRSRRSPERSSGNHTGDGRTDRSSRQHRASSTRESNLRISRPGFEWFFTTHLRDGDSSPEDTSASSSRNLSHALAQRGNLSRSLPPHFFRLNRDAKCPMCQKMIPAEDVEVHFVMCLTKPRVTYNEDVMSGTGGECSICLEDLQEGEAIARLPCLCVYHKVCIDKWFLKSQTCPEHPPD